MNGARLKHYGWGREGEGMSSEEQKFVLGRYRAKFARDAFDTIAVPLSEVEASWTRDYGKRRVVFTVGG